MTSETILFECSDGVALHRPDRLDSLTAAVQDALTAAMHDAIAGKPLLAEKAETWELIWKSVDTAKRLPVFTGR